MVAAAVEREAETRWLFNERELLAWHFTLKGEQRDPSKRKRPLRRFDETREPPKR
jgi:hypothetical protein